MFSKSLFVNISFNHVSSSFSLLYTFFIILFCSFLSYSFAQQSTQCSSHTDQSYHLAASPLNSSISALPLAGATRSIVIPSSYALITPESRVYAGPPPGWQGTLSAALLISPQIGAHFTMYLVNANPKANMPNGVVYQNAPLHLERFIYILTGKISINSSIHKHNQLIPGSFVYIAPNDSLSINVDQYTSFIMIDRIYSANSTPKSISGSEQDIPIEICDGEVFQLRRLLDKTNPSFDFNIHIMDFKPGQYLNVKEVHYNQHGLIMLQGHGIYRLAQQFFPVTTGDVIFMAPFVPQWYAALGTHSTRYFLYKDTNVDPLTSL